MNLRYLLLFLIISFRAISQSTPDWSHHTWAIKGKILPWVSPVPPTQGINYTIGAEYGFSKWNAIGLDLVYNDNNSHHAYTSGNSEGDVAGPSAYIVSRGAFLYYRRYLDLNRQNLKPIAAFTGTNYVPYVSVFARYGKTDDHYDPGFITSNISHDEWQYSAGFLVGAVTRYFDLNMGPFYKVSDTRDVENEPAGYVTYSHMTPSLGFRVGVNLFYVANKKSDHCLSKYAAGHYKPFWKSKKASAQTAD